MQVQSFSGDHTLSCATWESFVLNSRLLLSVLKSGMIPRDCYSVCPIGYAPFSPITHLSRVALDSNSLGVHRGSGESPTLFLQQARCYTGIYVDMGRMSSYAATNQDTWYSYCVMHTVDLRLVCTPRASKCHVVLTAKHKRAVQIQVCIRYKYNYSCTRTSIAVAHRHVLVLTLKSTFVW